VGETMKRLWAALGRHDPGYAALRRAIRAAIVMPGSFALCLHVIGNPVMAPFAAFGSIATLLLVDFRGPMFDRLRSQAALIVLDAALVALGTLCSRSTVLAVAAMAVLGVLIIFAGVVSSTLAGATTPLLLGFILPVSLPGDAAAIPDRVLGWGLAGGFSMLAIALLWPIPAADPLRRPAIAASRAVAAMLRLLTGDATAEQRDAARGETTAALAAVQRTFLATPFRPTSLTTAARAGVRLVDELRWVGEAVLGAVTDAEDGITAPGGTIAAVRLASATVLEQGADLLASVSADVSGLTRARHALTAATASLRDGVCLRRPAGAAGAEGIGDASVDAFVNSLDPAFRSQEASFVIDQIAANIEIVAAAGARGWVARVLGRQPDGIGGTFSSVAERAGSHLTPRSVWMRNSLRGGAALGIAVLIGHLFAVQHSFWISFGALSILRSNALSTGQTFLRALVGTVVGFVIGGALIVGIGTDTTVLWILLPFAVLIGGIAPAAISFVAGQAGFTVVLFILFNILAPLGWRLGIVRVEDIALGGGTSLLVGLLFWPRGAGAALGRALADAYNEGGRYLAGAVGYAVTCCAPGIPGASELGGAGGSGGRVPESVRAAAASRRLDDTFRTYLAEAGPKRIGLSDVTTIVDGASGLRLAADAIIDLWRDEEEPIQSRVGAARELLARARAEDQWYRELADALLGVGDVPEPAPGDPGADARLRETVDHDLRSADGNATAAAVRVVWTGDHLDAVRRLEDVVAGPVRDALHGGALAGTPLGVKWPLRPASGRPDPTLAARPPAAP
jgi:hypothetical protein